MYYLTEPDYSRDTYTVPSKLKHRIFNHLSIIYGTDVSKKIYSEIERLIKVHHAYIAGKVEFSEGKRKKFSQEDCILITYGDMFSGTGKTSLQNLKKFAGKYLKDCFNTIHILPFFPYSSDRGFSVTNFTEVDPKSGSWNDILDFKEEFNLMFDAVFNHISSKSCWFVNFLNGDPDFKDFFITISTDKIISEDHLKLIVRPRTTPLFSEYLTINGPKLVWTTFSRDQIDLNFRNPKLLSKILEILLFYIRMEANFIRLDAVTYLWEELGTECAHLQQTHALIKLFRDILDVTAPEVTLITETNVPHQKNIEYFGNGSDEAQMVYNFALPPLVLHSFMREDATILSEWAKTIDYVSQDATYFNFLDSHDGIGVLPVKDILDESEINFMVLKVIENGGFVSYRTDSANMEVPYELNITWYSALNSENENISRGCDKYIASRAVALSFMGIPGIYIHGLIGSKNDSEAVLREQHTRSINRKTCDLKEIEETLNNPTTIESNLLRRISDLLKIRKREKCFSPDSPQKIFFTDRRLFVNLRYSEESKEALLTVINVSSGEVPFVPDSEISGYISDKTINLINQKHYYLKHRFILSPYEVLWLKGIFLK